MRMASPYRMISTAAVIGEVLAIDILVGERKIIYGGNNKPEKKGNNENKHEEMLRKVV